MNRVSKTFKGRGPRHTAMAVLAVAIVLTGAIVAIATAGDHGRAGARRTAGHSEATRPATRGRLAVAARYLGLTKAQLRRDLRRGRSLAQVASTDGGRSTSGLIDALVSARAARLASAVAAGTLSKATESLRLARFRRRVAVLVDRRGGASRATR